MAFVTRGLIMIFGYSYPAYECYKTVEKNKVNIESLRFWCQYWILVALLTVFEKIAEIFVSWVPMYIEGKLVFFIYLWSPKTKGATYVYESFLRPYLSKHEKEIDRYLLDLRVRAMDFVILYWQKAASYGQTTIFGIIGYFAAQSLKHQTDQQQQGAGAPQVEVLSTVQHQPQKPSNGMAQLQLEAIQETGTAAAAAPTSAMPAQTAVADQPSKNVMAQKKHSEAAEMKPESVLKTSNGDLNSSVQPPQAIARDDKGQVLDKGQVTRARLRKSLATVSASSALPMSPKQNVNMKSRQ